MSLNFTHLVTPSFKRSVLSFHFLFLLIYFLNFNCCVTNILLLIYFFLFLFYYKYLSLFCFNCFHSLILILIIIINSFNLILLSDSVLFLLKFFLLLFPVFSFFSKFWQTYRLLICDTHCL